MQMYKDVRGGRDVEFLQSRNRSAGSFIASLEYYSFPNVGLSIILDTIIKKFDRRKPFEGTHRTVVCST